MATAKLQTEIQELRKEMRVNPQDVISNLFSLEKTIMGIYGSFGDPIVSNVARKIFIEKLFHNIEENLCYAALRAQSYDSAESKNVRALAIKLIKEMEEYDGSNKSLADFLNKKFKEAKVKTKTRAKLIPSFETFNGALNRLESGHHLLGTVPTSDKRAEIAYHLTIYNEWNENRKTLTSRLGDDTPKKHISEIASINELRFYDLTRMALNIEIERHKRMIDAAKKVQEPNNIKLGENYFFTTLTDVENEFLITYLKLEIRY